MDASGTTLSTNADKFVYYVMARNSGNISTSEFPYIYTVVEMQETDAKAFFAMERTVMALQRGERNLLLKGAARNPESRSRLLFKLYGQLNCLYDAHNHNLIYIRTEKPHQVGGIIYPDERVQLIGLRSNNRTRQARV